MEACLGAHPRDLDSLPKGSNVVPFLGLLWFLVERLYVYSVGSNVGISIVSRIRAPGLELTAYALRTQSGRAVCLAWGR